MYTDYHNDEITTYIYNRNPVIVDTALYSDVPLVAIKVRLFYNITSMASSGKVCGLSSEQGCLAAHAHFRVARLS